MKLKEKWLICLIILAVILGLVLAVKLLPIYVTIISIATFIFGIGSGWFMKRIHDMYFRPQ